MTRHLLIPGRGIPLPDHWLNRWAGAHPEYIWAPRPPGPPFVPAERVAALEAAVRASDVPVVLIAHSAGCLAAVEWALSGAGPVRGALLVTPPSVDGIPRQRLPFRTILVASRTDPYTTFRQFEEFARDWGADLVDAGEAGHLGTADGYGPWPEGERLVARLDSVDQGEPPGY